MYRITVKREEEGVVSRHLHDTAQPGDIFGTHNIYTTPTLFTLSTLSTLSILTIYILCRGRGAVRELYAAARAGACCVPGGWGGHHPAAQHDEGVRQARQQGDQTTESVQC